MRGLLDRVDERIAFLTGLNLTSAEDLQVLHYKGGGHYDCHWDWGSNNGKGVNREYDEDTVGGPVGGRVATFLIYLSEVEAGGATVFPGLGLGVRPRLGLGLFWFNLLASGEGDKWTRHAACPVLGEATTKWVANKWLHERGNDPGRRRTRRTWWRRRGRQRLEPEGQRYQGARRWDGGGAKGKGGGGDD